jgi:hypothetical protein
MIEDNIRVFEIKKIKHEMERKHNSQMIKANIRVFGIKKIKHETQ